MKINELFNSEKQMNTLYVNRPLKNAEEFITWAKNNGFETTLEPKKLHVTIAFSKETVDWAQIRPKSGEIVCENSSNRSIEQLGDQGAVVLRFECDLLRERWMEFLNLGASWDHDGYRPHITITYDPGKTNYKKIEPYKGPLIFGPEDIQEVDLEWASKVKEK